MAEIATFQLLDLYSHMYALCRQFTYMGGLHSTSIIPCLYVIYSKAPPWTCLSFRHSLTHLLTYTHKVREERYIYIYCPNYIIFYGKERERERDKDTHLQIFFFIYQKCIGYVVWHLFQGFFPRFFRMKFSDLKSSTFQIFSRLASSKNNPIFLKC